MRFSNIMCRCSIQAIHAFVFIIIALPVTCLKHHFATSHDNRSFIGPIGEPFGFQTNGSFTMKVLHFEIKLESEKSSSTSVADYNPKYDMDILYPGFLLKRFQSEQDFSRFEESILENLSQLCGFQDFLDEDFEISIALDDDFVATGPGVIDGGSDGIFLSMLNPTDILKSSEKTITIEHHFTAQEAGYYFLFYQICVKTKDVKVYTHPGEVKQVDLDKLLKATTSSFELEVEDYNIDVLGKVSYLTAGQMVLPHLFLYFSISYGLLLFLWLRSIRNQYHTTMKDDNVQTQGTKVYAVHHFMSCVVALKAICVLLESVRYHYIRMYGHAEFWTFLYYILHFMKGTFLFTVILLLGSGWSFFQSVLSPKQAKIILAVFFLQVLDNIAIIALTQETIGERLYNDWSVVLHLADIISCGAIVIPIIWQLRSIEDSLESMRQNYNCGDIDISVQDLEGRLSLFRSFYVIIVMYIYFTRVVIYLIASGLTYKYIWIKDFILELGTLLFYVSIGTLFIPKSEEDSRISSAQYAQVNTDDAVADINPDSFDDIDIELTETIVKP